MGIQKSKLKIEIEVSQIIQNNVDLSKHVAVISYGITGFVIVTVIVAVIMLCKWCKNNINDAIVRKIRTTALEVQRGEGV